MHCCLTVFALALLVMSGWIFFDISSQPFLKGLIGVELPQLLCSNDEDEERESAYCSESTTRSVATTAS